VPHQLPRGEEEPRRRWFVNRVRRGGVEKPCDGAVVGSEVDAGADAATADELHHATLVPSRWTCWICPAISLVPAGGRARADPAGACQHREVILPSVRDVRRRQIGMRRRATGKELKGKNYVSRKAKMIYNLNSGSTY
jgi:hypothetical protein